MNRYDIYETALLHCSWGDGLPNGTLHATEDTPGITLVRPMETFGDDDCPKGHMEILFEDATLHFVLADRRRLQYVLKCIDFLNVQTKIPQTYVVSLLRKKQQHL